MNPSLEIRKLPPSNVQTLAKILETHEQWKNLMKIIPKTLERCNYECPISASNHQKYNSEHFRLIETEAEKSRRYCVEVLFDEWGTSGRVRPALGHLLYLLTKANLLRAADYIAIDLLHQERPRRPDVGPAAEIPVNLSEIIQQEPDNEIEKRLDEIHYVDKAVNLIRTLSDKTPKRADQIPKIVITPDIDDNINIPKTMPIVVQRAKSTEEVSDMMKFPSSSSQDDTQGRNMPDLSIIMANKSIMATSNGDSTSTISNSDTNSELTSENLTSVSDQSSEVSDSMTKPISLLSDSYSPAFSKIMESPVDENIPNLSILNLEYKSEESTEGNIIPDLDILQHQSDKIIERYIKTSVLSEGNMIPDLDTLQRQSAEQSDSLPNISVLNLNHIKNATSLSSEGNLIPDLDTLQHQSSEQSDIIPNISALNLNGTSTEGNMIPDLDTLQRRSIEQSDLPNLSNLNLTQTSSDVSSKTRSCSSPLPNLSLDTVLPHYSYQNLELATNNFNEDLYKGENFEGRFLGKGEFGTVFLALKFLNRPIAVKKLDIGDVEIVNVDDEVTKQFRNEVEVLSKYRHDNLLSLLGYSCDGSTYCLLYEYIPGGALRDRLQDDNNKLLWKQRFNIALGTSKAISYLHSAFSTPLIHRDIKSANILLDSNNQPKLCDFGLIKLIPNQNSNTATTVFGTSAYMPREAFGGDISVKLDTFSFGVVLLELLTALPPIDSNREGADLVTHIGETIENDNIASIIDYKAGNWIENVVNYALKMYKVAQWCLEEKKKRPTMLEVKMVLQNIITEINI